MNQVVALAGGSLDGLVTAAGLAGLPSRPASLLVSVNYFGTVELLEGLRPALEAGTDAAAVAISSNSTTAQPGYSMRLVEACLLGDEAAACALAGEGESLSTYPVTKLALARWVRRHAPNDEWAGTGIRLNAIAPGAVETPLLQEGLDDPLVGPAIEQFHVPIGRRGKPDEIAALHRIPAVARHALLLRIGRVLRRRHRCAAPPRRLPVAVASRRVTAASAYTSSSAAIWRSSLR